MGQSHDAFSENLCRRCGVCCMLTIKVNGRSVAIPDLACKYLRPDGPLRFSCTVYEDRFSVAPWCLSARQALEQGVLAQDCPYRMGHRTGPVVLHPRLVRLIKADIIAALDAAPLPPWLDPLLYERFKDKV